MSRSLERTAIHLLPDSTFVEFFAVPPGHKYELIGVIGTAGTATTANVAGLHTFVDTSSILDWFIITDAAHAQVFVVDGLSEPFTEGESFSIVCAPESSDGQAMCWYIDVDYTD